METLEGAVVLGKVSAAQAAALLLIAMGTSVCCSDEIFVSDRGFVLTTQPRVLDRGFVQGRRAKQDTDGERVRA